METLKDGFELDIKNDILRLRDEEGGQDNQAKNLTNKGPLSRWDRVVAEANANNNFTAFWEKLSTFFPALLLLFDDISGW